MEPQVMRVVGARSISLEVVDKDSKASSLSAGGEGDKSGSLEADTENCSSVGRFVSSFK